MLKLVPVRVALLFCAWAMLCCGCGQPQPAPAEQSAKGPATTTNATEPNTSTPVNSTPVSTVPATVVEPARTPREMMERMVATYQSAKNYADFGQIVQRYTLNGQLVEKKEPFLIAWERPNRLRLECYNVQLANDGKVVRGMIRGRDGFLEQPAPASLTAENVVTDQTMQRDLSMGFGSNPPQLLLLFTKQALEVMIPPNAELAFLPDLTHDGQLCRRVKISNADGARVFWIDARNNLLRRFDYPLESLQQELAKQGTVSKLEQYADFKQAEVNGLLPPQTFEYALPPDAKLVKRILPIPMPLKPTATLGKAVPAFEFTDAKQQPITPKSVHGKVTVLTFWGTQFAPCREALPLVQAVANRLASDQRVQFYAVAVDGAEVSDATLQNALKQSGVELPLARDLRADAAKLLGVDGVPSLLVLGQNGVVEHHWPRLENNLPQALPVILDKLANGDSVFPLTQRDYEQRLAEYERMQQAPVAQPSAEIAIPLPVKKIAPASAPQNYAARSLWISSKLDIKQPGNLLLIPGTEKTPAALWAMDGWEAVCEFDLAGKMLARHELPLPERTAVSAIRTAVNGRGERVTIVFHPFDERGQLLVLDQQWQPLLVYPKDADRGSDKISDAQLADLDGDGELELIVGYYGQTGVQVANLRGERLWFNRSEVQTVFHMAMSEPNAQGQRRLFCPNEQGSAIPFDHVGTPGTPWTIPNQRILGMFGAPLGATATISLLGAMTTADLRLVMLGLDGNGKLKWNYTLPAGAHEHPVEIVSGARLWSDRGAWLMAGPDGSIHLVSDNGQLLEQFNTGKALRGIAGAEHNNQPVLFIATEGQIEATALLPLENPPATK